LVRATNYRVAKLPDEAGIGAAFSADGCLAHLANHACAFAGDIYRPSNRYSYMAETIPTEFFIQGVTSKGKTFRPSDWSERLCGVMSAFGPGKRGPNARLQYSVYVRPTLLGNVKTVILDARLRDIEPMAFDFVMNFAKDNDLLVTEACELPPHHATQKV
jgi:hypothetical protein